MLSGSVRIARAQPLFLLRLSALIFVPLGLLGTLDQAMPDLTGEEADEEAAGLLLATLALTITSLVGQLLFAGVVAAAVAEGLEGRPPSIAGVARRARWRTLIAIDLLATLGVIAGLLLLVVPAIAFFARYALAATVSDLEGLGVRDSFRRSARISKGRRTLVLAILIGALIVSSIFDQAIAALVPGGGFLADWAAASISGIVTNPIFAIASVALVVELDRAPAGRRRRGR